MCPFRNEEDLAVDYVRDEGVAESDGVAVFGGGRRRVGIAQGVGRFGIVTMMAEIVGPEVFLLAVFEVECCFVWLVISVELGGVRMGI